MQCNGENIALTFVPKACALECFNVSFFRKWSHIKWNNKLFSFFTFNIKHIFKHDAKKLSYVFQVAITAQVRRRLMAAKQIMVY